VRVAQFILIASAWSISEFETYFLMMMIFQIHETLKADGLKELYLSETGDLQNLTEAKSVFDSIRTLLTLLGVTVAFLFVSASPLVILILFVYILLDIETPSRLMRLHRQENFSSLAKIEFWSTLITLCVVVGTIITGSRIEYIFLGYLSKPLLVIAFTNFDFRNFFNWNSGLNEIYIWKKHIFLYFMTAIVFSLTSRVDKFIVSEIVENPAYFFFAFSICQMSLNLTAKAISAVFISKYARKLSLKIALRQMLILLVILSLAGCTLIWLFPAFERIIFQGKWEPAYKYIIPLTIFFVLRGLALETPFVAGRRAGLRLINECVLALVLVGSLLTFLSVKSSAVVLNNFTLAYPAAALVGFIYWSYVFSKVYKHELN
jgi:hypothetical protein